MTLSTYLSIITLNVNRLNSPIKRPRVDDGLKKNSLYAVHKRLTSDINVYTD